MARRDTDPRSGARSSAGLDHQDVPHLAGEGGLRPHQLRDFSLTQLVAAGVPEVEVMGRHGHASASSMKPYRHYIRAKDRMSTETMRDVLGRFVGLLN